jgi:pimeloyl-ACP methyl ester carboxylesterase
VRQRDASRSFDCADRLREIRMPTLILHGRSDRVAPYRLAEEMHAGIQNSKLIAFRGGHIFFFLCPRQVMAAVSAFLATV